MKSKIGFLILGVMIGLLVSTAFVSRYEMKIAGQHHAVLLDRWTGRVWENQQDGLVELPKKKSEAK